ncbi:MAG: Smr/MutS family protein [Gammaproteobacteria bacterium]|nr:Smr/MutS family protein [Gammaproteobacteria bacterium]
MSSSDKKSHYPEFKQAVAGVTPLKDDNRANLKKKPKPAKYQHYDETENELQQEYFSDGQEIELLGFEDTLSFCHDSISSRYFSDLKSGRIPIEEHLDLHGLTINQARHDLSLFIQFCFHHQIRCIKIIHGKGYRKNQSYPILKNKANSWLRQHPQILAFHSAIPKDGGTGAVYVLLAKS